MYPIIIVYNDNDSNAHRRSLLFRSMNTCVMVPHSQTCMNAVSPVRTKRPEFITVHSVNSGLIMILLS